MYKAVFGRRFRWRSSAIGLLISLSALTGTAACRSGQPDGAASRPPTPVKIEVIANTPVSEASEFVGTLEALNRVTVRPQIDGRIVSINAERGDRVSQGQVLIQLQPVRQQEEVNAAQSAVGVQAAALESSRAELRAQEAERDRTRLEIDRRRADAARAEAELRGREAEVQARRADLELAEENLKRAEFLVATGAQAQQELDNRKRDYDTARANLDAAQKARDAAAAAGAAVRQSVSEAVSSAAASEERVAASRAAVARQQESVREAQSRLGVSQVTLDYNRVVAPVNGIVGDIPVRVGDYVNLGQELTTLTQNDALALRIGIPVERFEQLRLGLPVEVVDRQNRVVETGQLTFIEPRVDPQAQTILVQATFFDPGERVRDGQYIRARVVWQEEVAPTVPTVAVTRIGNQSFVFVAEEETGEDGESRLVARQKPVQLGPIQGQAYEVQSGVNAGDRLIVSGIQRLADGAPIAPENATSGATAEPAVARPDD